MVGKQRQRWGVVAAILCGGIGSSTATAFESWANATGVASFFTWSGGGSDNGIWGSPTLVGGNTFEFLPDTFLTSGTGGILGSTQDRLEVTLLADPGQSFSTVTVKLWGTYEQKGDLESSVSETGALFLTNVLNPKAPEMKATIGDPSFPIVKPTGTPSLSGNWTASVEINLLILPKPAWTEMTLVFNDLLQAMAEAEGLAMIQLTRAEVTVMPSPGLGCCLGAILLVSRRRR